MVKRRKSKTVRPTYASLERRQLLACDLLGTNGHDMIRIEVGTESVAVTINGVESECPLADLSIDARDGNDSIVIVDSAGNDRAELRHGSVLVEGDIRIEALNVESVEVKSGGGGDTAYLFDTAGVETLFANAAMTLLRGSDFDLRAVGYLTVIVDSQSAVDTAYIGDSITDDIFFGGDTHSSMQYGNGARVDLTNFFSVFAKSTVGGSDQAVLVGSATDDVVLSTETFARIANGQFRVRASNFEIVLATESTGYDRAIIKNTGGKETFYGSPELGHFKYRNGEVASFVNFERVSLIARNSGITSHVNGFDTVYVEAGDGIDRMFASEKNTILLGDGYEFYFERVRIVRVVGNGGDDILKLFDLAGDAGVRSGYDRPLKMSRSGGVSYYIQADDFVDISVTALVTGSNGISMGSHSFDKSEFFWQPGFAKFVSPNLKVQASNFKYVGADANRDSDSVAFINGSNQNDELTYDGRRLRFAGDGFSLRSQFPTTYIDGRGGADSAIFNDSVAYYGDDSFVGDDSFIFRGNTGIMQASHGTSLSATNFANYVVTAEYGSRIGNDVVFLYDSEDDDELQGFGDRVRLVNDLATVTLKEIPTIHAVARSGGINTWAVHEFIGATTIFRVGDWIDGTPIDPFA